MKYTDCILNILVIINGHILMGLMGLIPISGILVRSVIPRETVCATRDTVCAIPVTVCAIPVTVYRVQKIESAETHNPPISTLSTL